MIVNSKDRFFRFFIYAFFIFLAVLMLYPLWYVLMFSLSELGRVSLNNYYLVPDGFSLESYTTVMRYPPVLTGFKNSAFVTGVGTLVCLMMTVITAYPLSREPLTGKKFYFGMMMFTMIFSGGMIPTYLVIRAVGLVDSLWALIIPGAINVYYVLVMIKFFKGIPISLIESAKIDGYNDISILFRIVLPLSKASLASIGLFYAVIKWNVYVSAVMYITDTKKRVIQVVVRGMLMEDLQAEATGAGDSTPQSMRMAAIMVSLLPILCVYPFLQKYFMKGVTLGAVKG